MSVFDELMSWRDSIPPASRWPSRLEVAPDFYLWLRFRYGSPSELSVQSGSLLSLTGVPVVMVCVLAPMTWRFIDADGEPMA